jgi:hypothetical protein
VGGFVLEWTRPIVWARPSLGKLASEQWAAAAALFSWASCDRDGGPGPWVEMIHTPTATVATTSTAAVM